MMDLDTSTPRPSRYTCNKSDEEMSEFINVISWNPFNSRDHAAMRDPATSSRRRAVRRRNVIRFTREDLEYVTPPPEDMLIVTLDIAGYDVKRILIDERGFDDILYKGALIGLGRKWSDLQPPDVLVLSSTDIPEFPRGSITLPVTMGSGAASITTSISFQVVNRYGIYNAVLGRETTRALGIIASPVHQKMKFPTPHGIGEVLTDRAESRKFYIRHHSLREQQATASTSQEEDDPPPEVLIHQDSYQPYDTPESFFRRFKKIGILRGLTEHETIISFIRRTPSGFPNFKELFARESPTTYQELENVFTKYSLGISPKKFIL
jgi:hypothetical protein